MNTEPPASPTTRRRFLGQAAALVGVGAGALLLDSEPATGAPPKYTCCRDSSCEFCPGERIRYRCTGVGCSPSNSCQCFLDKPNCFTVAC